MLFERGRPGNELETKTIVDHREASGGERQALTVGTGDILAALGALEGLAGLSSEFFAEGVHLSAAERVKEVAAEDNAPPLPFGEAFPNEMFSPPVEGATHLRAEPAFGQCRGVARDVLP